MAALDDLLRELSVAVQARDIDGMRRVRQSIAADHPQSEAALEAQYRLGLDALFFGRDIDRALALFEEAGKAKHPIWAPAARTSLALCLLHLGREQKGMFELRKVAFAKEASMHSVTALALMEVFCGRNNQVQELARVRKERAVQLERLAHAPGAPPRERGHYLAQLGLLYLDVGDSARGRATLAKAKALGPEAVGAEEMQRIEAGLLK